MNEYMGIDIGTNLLGWAFVDEAGAWLDGGACEFKNEKRGFDGLLERLLQVSSWAARIFHKNRPCKVGIEEPLFIRSRHTPIVLGMVFGIVAVAATKAEYRVVRIMPSQGKQAMTGNGNASKAEVLAAAKLQGMTYTGPGEQDAADAFGVALAARNAHILETLP